MPIFYRLHTNTGAIRQITNSTSREVRAPRAWVKCGVWDSESEDKIVVMRCGSMGKMRDYQTKGQNICLPVGYQSCREN